MKVSVVYANPKRQFWTTVDIPEGSRVQDAIERSSVLRQFPEIDLATQKVGIFSKIVALDAAIEEGDRVEIYRPLTADPKTIQTRAKERAGAASKG
jgi:uncharacterized protein